MATIVGDCPRCGAKNSTFDCPAAHYIFSKHGWQQFHELFSICRNCSRTVTFQISDKPDGNYKETHEKGLLSFKAGLNNRVYIEGWISLKDKATLSAPEYTPDTIAAAFNEGATSLAVGCWNAAGTMFRLCIDLTTKELLPQGVAIKRRTQKDLAPRLAWLFDNGYLPRALKELSNCIREDGNDAAHAGTLTKADALDLADFASALLERIYTEPERIKLAEARRLARRTPSAQTGTP